MLMSKPEKANFFTFYRKQLMRDIYQVFSMLTNRWQKHVRKFKNIFYKIPTKIISTKFFLNSSLDIQVGI